MTLKKYDISNLLNMFY